VILSLTPDEMVIEARTASIPVRIGDLDAVIEAGTPLRLERGAEGWRAAA